MTKRKVSESFRKTRQEMRSKLLQCNDCTDYATELHHIVAVEDGGTDDLNNLMPLCRECHREYTSGQTIERNQIWVELSIDDRGELVARYKGEKDEIIKGDQIPEIESGRSEYFSADEEKPTILESNKPVKFLIETKMGSIIRVVLIPDNQIEIISKGDINKAELIVDDDCAKESFSTK